MGKLALITGASSGIGRELALVHAAAGGDCVLVARREDELRALAEEIEGRHGVRGYVIASDLTDDGAPQRLRDEVADRGLRVDYLVNNAGFGGRGMHHERPLEVELAMIRLNVEALTALTRLYLPEMTGRGSGRIMNVASTAAFFPGPLQAVYYATKAYVLSYSQAVAVELEGTGVTVTALCPGPTRTEFFSNADLGGTLLSRLAVPADRVARSGYRAMLAGRTVAVVGWSNKIMAFSRRLAPAGVAARIARLMQR